MKLKILAKSGSSLNMFIFKHKATIPVNTANVRNIIPNIIRT